MKKRVDRLFRPIVFVLCLGLLVWMVQQVGFMQLWDTLCSMPGTIALCVIVWGIGYLLNAASFSEVLQGQGQKLAYSTVLRLTVTGYAINYVTPFGLLGGEPYRVYVLKPLMGTERAMRSVALYSSMHVASHFCFWALAAMVGLICLGGNGSVQTGESSHFSVALSLAGVFGLFDWRKLPSGHRYRALFYEFISRMINVVEYLLIMQVLGYRDFGYIEAFLCVAFSSLFANVLFFSPMQMGTREGGIYLSLQYLLPQLDVQVLLPLALSLSFATHIREFIWIAIGLFGIQRSEKAMFVRKK